MVRHSPYRTLELIDAQIKKLQEMSYHTLLCQAEHCDICSEAEGMMNASGTTKQIS